MARANRGKWGSYSKMSTIKYKECPMCHQTLIDLSDNPMFVNPNPEKFNAHTGTNRSDSSNLGGIPLSNGCRSDSTMDTRSSEKRSKNRKMLNFVEKEKSKDTRK